VSLAACEAVDRRRHVHHRSILDGKVSVEELRVLRLRQAELQEPIVEPAAAG
jgi:hypothetical protein